jgi:DNA-binding IclR family transcriptional regulator
VTSRSARPTNYSIAVLERSIDLLEVMADAGEPKGVSELARAIGSTKSATFRILATLEDRGYVSRVEEIGKYQLGLNLVHIGQSALERIDLRTVARPVLEDLHERFNETVNLGVLAGGRIVYVDMVESDHGLRMSARIGAHDNVHSTAIGKAILANLLPDQQEELLHGPLPARTEKTLTDVDALRQEIERIKVSGFSRDRGENENGACCFGAPIFDAQGRVVAAISVSGPDTRLAGEVAEDVAVAVRAAAQEITNRLGGRGERMSAEGHRFRNSVR